MWVKLNLGVHARLTHTGVMIGYSLPPATLVIYALALSCAHAPYVGTQAITCGQSRVPRMANFLNHCSSISTSAISGQLFPVLSITIIRNV